jgi:hypothetical protein
MMVLVISKFYSIFFNDKFIDIFVPMILLSNKLIYKHFHEIYQEDSIRYLSVFHLILHVSKGINIIIYLYQ